MKKIAMSVIIMAVAGGGYAADFGQQLSVKAKDIKVLSAENKNIAVPTLSDTKGQENGPVFMCGSSGYPLWSFTMKSWNNDGYWYFNWPAPEKVKPVPPQQSAQHTGATVPNSALNNALVYQTTTESNSNVTLVITPCAGKACPAGETNGTQGQTHEILVVSPSMVLFGTCHIQK